MTTLDSQTVALFGHKEYDHNSAHLEAIFEIDYYSWLFEVDILIAAWDCFSFRHMNDSATEVQRRWRGFLGRKFFRLYVKVGI